MAGYGPPLGERTGGFLEVRNPTTANLIVINVAIIKYDYNSFAYAPLCP